MAATGKPGVNRHSGNPLKPHATTDIEQAIADSIKLLTGGYGYGCRISKIDFTDGSNNTGAKIDLILFRMTKTDDDTVKSDYERERENKDNE